MRSVRHTDYATMFIAALREKSRTLRISWERSLAAPTTVDATQPIGRRCVAALRCSNSRSTLGRFASSCMFHP